MFLDHNDRILQLKAQWNNNLKSEVLFIKIARSHRKTYEKIEMIAK